jgi:hypothetical protein
MFFIVKNHWESSFTDNLRTYSTNDHRTLLVRLGTLHAFSVCCVFLSLVVA